MDDKEIQKTGRAAIAHIYDDIKALTTGPKTFDQIKPLMSFMWMLSDEGKAATHRWHASLLSKATTSSTKRKGAPAATASSVGSSSSSKWGKSAAASKAANDDLADLFG